jgi:hypothetical protein
MFCPVAIGVDLRYNYVMVKHVLVHLALAVLALAGQSSDVPRLVARDANRPGCYRQHVAVE